MSNRLGTTTLHIPRKGGKMRVAFDIADANQRGRDNAAKSIRFERREKRKLKNS
jgi:hypothetical protein